MRQLEVCSAGALPAESTVQELRVGDLVSPSFQSQEEPEAPSDPEA